MPAFLTSRERLSAFLGCVAGALYCAAAMTSNWSETSKLGTTTKPSVQWEDTGGIGSINGAYWGLREYCLQAPSPLLEKVGDQEDGYTCFTYDEVCSCFHSSQMRAMIGSCCLTIPSTAVLLGTLNPYAFRITKTVCIRDPEGSGPVCLSGCERFVGSCAARAWTLVALGVGLFLLVTGACYSDLPQLNGALCFGAAIAGIVATAIWCLHQDSVGLGISVELDPDLSIGTSCGLCITGWVLCVIAGFLGTCGCNCDDDCINDSDCASCCSCNGLSGSGRVGSLLLPPTWLMLLLAINSPEWSYTENLGSAGDFCSPASNIRFIESAIKFKVDLATSTITPSTTTTSITTSESGSLTDLLTSTSVPTSPTTLKSTASVTSPKVHLSDEEIKKMKSESCVAPVEDFCDTRKCAASCLCYGSLNHAETCECGWSREQKRCMACEETEFQEVAEMLTSPGWTWSSTNGCSQLNTSTTTVSTTTSSVTVVTNVTSRTSFISSSANSVTSVSTITTTTIAATTVVTTNSTFRTTTDTSIDLGTTYTTTVDSSAITMTNTSLGSVTSKKLDTISFSTHVSTNSAGISTAAVTDSSTTSSDRRDRRADEDICAGLSTFGLYQYCISVPMPIFSSERVPFNVHDITQYKLVCMGYSSSVKTAGNTFEQSGEERFEMGSTFAIHRKIVWSTIILSSLFAVAADVFSDRGDPPTCCGTEGNCCWSCGRGGIVKWFMIVSGLFSCTSVFAWISMMMSLSTGDDGVESEVGEGSGLTIGAWLVGWLAAILYHSNRGYQPLKKRSRRNARSKSKATELETQI